MQLASIQRRAHDPLTEERQQVHLLPVLVLISASNSRSAWSNLRHATNLREHVSRSHRQHRDDSDDAPRPARDEDGANKADGQCYSHETEGKRDPKAPSDGCVVGNGLGGVLGELTRERFGVKAAADYY